MRHFCANFFRACGKKELADDLKEICIAFSERRFANLYKKLLVNNKLDAGGHEFLIGTSYLGQSGLELIMMMVGGTVK